MSKDLVLLVLALFASAVKEIVEAGEDRKAQEAALMKVEEALFQARLQTKFGGH